MEIGKITEETISGAPLTLMLEIHQKIEVCPYCGQTQENHLVTLNTPERRLETCMNVLADFVAHNLPSKWVKE